MSNSTFLCLNIRSRSVSDCRSLGQWFRPPVHARPLEACGTPHMRAICWNIRWCAGGLGVCEKDFLPPPSLASNIFCMLESMNLCARAIMHETHGTLAQVITRGRWCVITVESLVLHLYASAYQHTTHIHYMICEFFNCTRRWPGPTFRKILLHLTTLNCCTLPLAATQHTKGRGWVTITNTS